LNRNSRFQNKYKFLYCVFQKAVRVRKERETAKKREGRMNEKYTKKTRLSARKKSARLSLSC
jgi:hypothetical protein